MDNLCIVKQEMASKTKDVVIVGDGMCGKTSLLNVFLNQHFPPVYIPTIIENHSLLTNIDDQDIRINFWDTGDQEDFEVFRPTLFRQASVLIAMYSVDRRESLENIREKWIPEVREHNPKVPIILVACKTDLRNKPSAVGESSADDVITEWEGKQVARKINALAYRECSALTSQGTREVFQTAVYKTQVKKQRNPLNWLTTCVKYS